MRKWYLPVIGLGSLAMLAYSLRQLHGPEWFLGRKDRATEPSEESDHEVEGELERIQGAVDRVAASLAASR